jgi:hypothetical protein
MFKKFLNNETGNLNGNVILGLIVIMIDAAIFTTFYHILYEPVGITNDALASATLNISTGATYNWDNLGTAWVNNWRTLSFGTQIFFALWGLLLVTRKEPKSLQY